MADRKPLVLVSGRKQELSSGDRLYVPGAAYIGGLLGIGVTPHAWDAGSILQIGSGGSFLFGDSYQNISGSNSYYSGGWKRHGITYKPTQYNHADGVHRWYAADAGAVDSAITWSQLMTLDASGLSAAVPVSGTLKGAKQTKVAMPASDIDLNGGDYFTKTISATTTFTVSNVPAAGTVGSFILDLTNGGSQTINWWAGMDWVGGAAPSLTAAGRDVLGFFTHDGGTTWTGLLLGKDVK